MSIYRVLVCGGRHYDDVDKIAHVLDAQLAKRGASLHIIAGGATGADEIARQWAVEHSVDHTILYARWHLEGKAAGPLRNRRMAKLKPRLVLAFHPRIDESRGTSDMMRVAKRLDIKTKLFT